MKLVILILSLLSIAFCQDLAIYSFSLSRTTLNVGEPIGSLISLVLRNQGTVGTGGIDFSVGFYLSSDSVITSSDTLLIGGREFVTDAVAAGASVSVPLYSGAYIGDSQHCGRSVYLGVLVDEANAITETNEFNNNRSISVSVNCSPDLTVNSFSLSSTYLTINQEMGSTVSFSLKNIGAPTDGTDFAIGFYISTDSTITAGDILINGGREFVTAAVANGEVVNVTLFSGAKIITNTICGPAYFGVLVDDVNYISESDENNNEASIPVIINCNVDSPDLVIQSFSISNPYITVNQSIGSLISTIIANNGGATDGTDFSVGFYISVDPIITTSDYLLIGGREFITSAVASLQQVNVPLWSGAYVGDTSVCGPAYLGAIVDDSFYITETFEFNNNASIPVTINCEAGLPDLYPASFSLSTVDIVVNQTMGSTVTFSIGNLGAATDGTDIAIGFYISADDVITENDTLLIGGREFEVNVLASNTQVPVTLFSGAYYQGGICGPAYFGVLVNEFHYVTESIYSNNYQAIRVFIHCNELPDLRVNTFSLTSSTLNIDTPIGDLVELIVGNSGSATDGTDISIGFYLSTDNVITTSDMLLNGGREFIVDPVAAGGLAGVNLFSGAKILGNSICGSAFFGVVIDEFNAVTESNENNNVGVIPVTIVCTSNEPNLFIASFECDPSYLINTNMGASVSLTVGNSGGATDGTDISVGFYISSDNVITTSDTLLLGGREFITDAIASNGQVNVPLYSGAQIQTSSLCGNYFFGVVIDELGAIDESDETDNSRSIPIYIDCSGTGTPDLYIYYFDISNQTTISLDQEIGALVTIQVGNRGTNDCPGDPNIAVAVYISTDDVITTEDRLLQGGREFITITVPANEAVNVPLASSAIVSSDFPDENPICGEAYIGVIVDETEVVSEISETNNYAVIAVTIDCGTYQLVPALLAILLLAFM